LYFPEEPLKEVIDRQHYVTSSTIRVIGYIIPVKKDRGDRSMYCDIVLSSRFLFGE
jgi:hypothetical protein